jgi:CheY-like chemotaxis protein
MAVPLRDRASGAVESQPRIKNGRGVPTLSGNRVLLVEDEALVGMMMKDALNDLGYEVVGPFSTVPEARAAVFEDDFHAAILDVNLHGEPVYPLADLITAREVPFVFVTGYSADGIDRRFAHVPVLQKPVERCQLQQIFARPSGSEGEPGSYLHALFRRRKLSTAVATPYAEP